MNRLTERQQFLNEELAEYESVTPMTDSEREALHEWVSEGHSVHENWSLACWDGGAPLDFLDVYREEMKIYAMSEEERAEYLYKEYGYRLDEATQTVNETAQPVNDPMMEDTPWPEQ